MKVLEKVRHVADVGAAESVNGLIVITNRENRIQRRTVWPKLLTGQDFEPAVLQNVGILKLVDENMTEALLIVRANKVIAGEQLVAAKKQFCEIHYPLLLTFPLVSLVKPETQIRRILAETPEDLSPFSLHQLMKLTTCLGSVFSTSILAAFMSRFTRES